MSHITEWHQHKKELNEARQNRRDREKKEEKILLNHDQCATVYKVKMYNMKNIHNCLVRIGKIGVSKESDRNNNNKKRKTKIYRTEEDL